ncbi:MAG: hypothetical protein PHI98_14875 [Eubacteriales bacterium]|nr:hypothetical protein [Eubacteriales bacterium]
MKIKELAKLCRSSRYVTIMNRMDKLGGIGRQWISVGAAIYPIDGMPTVDTETILTVFDVPKDEHKRWSVREADANLLDIYIEDNYTDDREAQIGITSIGLESGVYTPFFTPHGMMMIRNEYLAPLADIKRSMQYYVREVTENTYAIIVKYGMQLAACIGVNRDWARQEGVDDELRALYMKAQRLKEEQQQEHETAE